MGAYAGAQAHTHCAARSNRDAGANAYPHPATEPNRHTHAKGDSDCAAWWYGHPEADTHSPAANGHRADDCRAHDHRSDTRKSDGNPFGPGVRIHSDAHANPVVAASNGYGPSPNTDQAHAYGDGRDYFRTNQHDSLGDLYTGSDEHTAARHSTDADRNDCSSRASNPDARGNANSQTPAH